MATSYRRVSVLLPVPPYNKNSAFILEKKWCKKYVNNLEQINRDKKKNKKNSAVVSVFGYERFGTRVQIPAPVVWFFFPWHLNEKKSSNASL